MKKPQDTATTLIQQWLKESRDQTIEQQMGMLAQRIMNLMRDVRIEERKAIETETYESKAKPQKPKAGDKKWMRLASDAALARMPDNYGFILMGVPFGPGKDRRLFYSSNLERDCAVATLKEWLIRAGHDEEWMKHIK